MYFIIWSYLDGSIRVEKTNTLLKTYTHSCEHPVRDARNLYIHRRKIKAGLLRRFAPRNDTHTVIASLLLCRKCGNLYFGESRKKRSLPSL